MGARDSANRLVPLPRETWLTYRGNLSQRSLLDVVKKGDLVENSEFMETLLVAVPKSVFTPSLLSHAMAQQDERAKLEPD